MAKRTKEKSSDKAADQKPADDKAKAKRPTAADRAELTEEKLAELEIAMRDFGDAAADYETKHAEAGAAKKAMEREQARVNGINRDLIDIRTGNYNLRLNFPKEPKSAPGEDPAAKFPLDKLTEFGLTSNMVEKLLSGTTCRTIGDLEQHMRNNEWWHSTIPGFGEDKVNKLIDALLAMRQKHPHPEPATETTELPTGPAIDDGNTVFDMPAPRLPVLESNGEAKLK